MNYTREEVSKGLQRYIKARGFMQSSLARQIGITEQALSDALNARRALRLEELYALCDAMGCSPNDVRYFDDN